MTKVGPTSNFNDSPAGVLFIKRTPGGRLVNLLRKEEEKLFPVIGHRLKLVEKCGVKLKNVLWKADPWGGIACDDLKCPICLEESDRPICKVANAIYTNTCKICMKEGKKTQYVGETSRTLIERSKEHHRDKKDMKRTSHMREHMLDEHPDQEISFKFDLLKRCNTPLERQVGETVHAKIMKDRGINIINNKFEYNRCLLPTLTVSGGEEKSTDKKKNEKRMLKIQEEEELIRDFEEIKESSNEDMKRDRRETENEEDKSEETDKARKRVKLDTEVQQITKGNILEKGKNKVQEALEVQEVFQSNNQGLRKRKEGD